MTTKITSGSAPGAGTSKGSTTGAGTAGFGASSSWSAIANETTAAANAGV